MFIYKMEQGQVNMIIIALLAVNIILGIVCVFKKGSSEEEFGAAPGVLGQKKARMPGQTIR